MSDMKAKVWSAPEPEVKKVPVNECTTRRKPNYDGNEPQKVSEDKKG